ncbi:hypothetical protein GIB67_007027 [Kingdonia uniflora]|uniref:Uncharacterized protein n=1 Tax=Kingdonia uniflora TaxID=39325 RepID=A0A7J7P007_9MAGN|nr:hypothetical protein GIB67_007027 [Kingdonia uniflora]
MIKPKRLIEMAKKWQKAASAGRKVADKGHFVVYSSDKKRFVVPLTYLASNIFRELFRMSEEEYGLPGDQPITLPCDAFFLEYAILFVGGFVSQDLEKTLLEYVNSVLSSQSSVVQEVNSQQVLRCF